MTVFLITFLLLLAVGLYANFQRPPVYRSSASLLTVAPADIDKQIAEADLQHVSIQRQRLLSKPLLEQVVLRLNEEGGGTMPPLSAQQLLPMLNVLPIAETNLLEVRAEGADAALLPRLVNTLLNTYLDERAAEIRDVSAATSDALRSQYEELGVKIARKREEMDRFRRDNEILSIGRDENEVLARLTGLTTSLNTAIEEEVKAKAKLDAIQAAVGRGEAVVPDEDKRTLAQMEQRAQQLREKLADLDSRYTRDFLQLDPKLQVIPGQLAELERKIREERDSGRKIVATDAEQEYAAARQTVQELNRQLEEHKQKASEFTARFAEHEALQEDLLRLEELYRDIEERLVQIELENRQKYPQVKVVEWAFQPDQPISPLYMRDAGIVVGAAVVLALFVVWLVDYLRPKSSETVPAPLNGVAFYPAREVPVIEQERSISRLETEPTPGLESPLPRELTAVEIGSLFNEADQATRQLIVLLLAGLSADEILAMLSEDLNTTTGELLVRGDPVRTVQVPPEMIGLFNAEQGPTLLLQGRDGEAPDPDELDARLQLAAADAGLHQSGQVNCGLLRHSYIAYLVRQGVRLAEVGRVVGQMPPKVLASYSRISPAGPGRTLAEINLFYPLAV